MSRSLHLAHQVSRGCSNAGVLHVGFLWCDAQLLISGGFEGICVLLSHARSILFIDFPLPNVMFAHFFRSLVTLHLWTCWIPKLCSVEPQEEGNGSLCKARRDCEQAFEGGDECWWCFVLWIGREIDRLLICDQGIVDLFVSYDLLLSCFFFSEMRKLNAIRHVETKEAASRTTSKWSQTTTR